MKRGPHPGGVLVVSLDLDETLTSDRALERTVALAQLDELTRERGGCSERRAAETAFDVFFASARNTDRTTDAFIGWFYERFTRAGFAAEQAAHAYREAVLARVAEHLTLLPGARETLDAFARVGLPYGMITNGWSPLQEMKAQLIDFGGPVFVSELIGARKPSPQAFAPLLAHFGVPHRNVWHVGDNPHADCGGARKAGMTSVWFDRGILRYPADVPAPDYIVRSHAELRALVTEHACAEAPIDARRGERARS